MSTLYPLSTPVESGFNKYKNYSQIVFQEGKEVLMKELNETQEQAKQLFITLASKIIGDSFINDGFKVVQAGSPANNFMITSGECILNGNLIALENNLIYSDQRYDGDDPVSILSFGNTTNTPPALTTPGSARTDLVVMNIILRDIDETIDPDIIDPALATETTLRYKLYITFRVFENVVKSDIANYKSYFEYYNDDFCFRAPLAFIDRLASNADITTAMLTDIRGNVYSGDLWQKIYAYVAGLQGSGNGFNSDKVDSRDVNDLLDTTANLWTASKTKTYIDQHYLGLQPKPDIRMFWDAATHHLPDNPVGTTIALLEGDIFISTSNYSGWLKDHMYKYHVPNIWEELVVQAGWLVKNIEPGYNYEESLTPANHKWLAEVDLSWYDFGAIADHSDLTGVLPVDDSSANAVFDKHVSDNYMKITQESIAQNAEDIATEASSARNADNLTSGTVALDRIPNTIRKLLVKSTNFTLLPNTKNLINTYNVEASLPASANEGDSIEIFSDGLTKIVQTDAEHLMTYQNSKFTTKGLTGYLKTLFKNTIELIYKGLGWYYSYPFTKLGALDALAGAGWGCSFSPDGKYLAFAHSTTPFATVYQNNFDGTFTKLGALAALAGVGLGCSFSPDGKYLAFGSQSTPFATVYQNNFDGTFTKLGALAALAGAGYGCSFSPDGKYLAFASDTTPFATVYQNNFDGTFTKLGALAALAGVGYGCSFSPDGKYLAFASDTTPFATVYQNNFDGTFTKLGALAALAGVGWECSFSPDGKYLAFGSQSTPPFAEVYQNNFDGTFTKLGALAALAGVCWGCSFSPDGKYLAFASRYYSLCNCISK